AARGLVAVAAAGRVDDNGRDRARDDRQIAPPPCRQHQSGRRIARIEPCRLVPPVREVRNPGVTLRARITAYVVALHVMFAGLAVSLFRYNRFWLLAIEAIFALSL